MFFKRIQTFWLCYHILYRINHSWNIIKTLLKCNLTLWTIIIWYFVQNFDSIFQGWNAILNIICTQNMFQSLLLYFKICLLVKVPQLSPHQKSAASNSVSSNCRFGKFWWPFLKFLSTKWLENHHFKFGLSSLNFYFKGFQLFERWDNFVN